MAPQSQSCCRFFLYLILGMISISSDFFHFHKRKSDYFDLLSISQWVESLWNHVTDVTSKILLVILFFCWLNGSSISIMLQVLSLFDLGEDLHLSFIVENCRFIASSTLLAKSALLPCTISSQFLLWVSSTLYSWSLAELRRLGIIYIVFLLPWGTERGQLLLVFSLHWWYWLLPVLCLQSLYSFLVQVHFFSGSHLHCLSRLLRNW